jgi:hypothetical protein
MPLIKSGPTTQFNNETPKPNSVVAAPKSIDVKAPITPSTIHPVKPLVALTRLFPVTISPNPGDTVFNIVEVINESIGVPAEAKDGMKKEKNVKIKKNDNIFRSEILILFFID